MELSKVDWESCSRNVFFFLLDTSCSMNDFSGLLAAPPDLSPLVQVAETSFCKESIMATIPPLREYFEQLLLACEETIIDSTYEIYPLLTSSRGRVGFSLWNAGMWCDVHNHGAAKGFSVLLRGDVEEQWYISVAETIQRNGEPISAADSGGVLEVPPGHIHSIRGVRDTTERGLAALLNVYAPSQGTVTFFDVQRGSTRTQVIPF
jgi:predicted metal-dependent enzyme (double-stranded beta helix superfamily)